jgi:NADH-quinone oxidoreductase subunit M
VELILFLPLLISLIAFFLPTKFVKEFSLAFSAVFFVLSFSLLSRFDPHSGFNFTYYNDLILKDIGGSLFIGLDGIGLLMVLLTNFVVLYVNLMAWNKKYPSSFYGLVFLMQFALIGVFSSYNAILFYLFWELALIPIYFIVFKWGTGLDTKQTFTRFFIYTFVGSLLILAAFILFYSATGINSYELKFMIPKSLEGNTQILFTTLLIVGFGVKIPIFPLHSWQADTYRKAPAEGTVLLSGIMLKMGLYGIYRWLVPFQENANPHIQSIVMIFCIIGILYGAFIALRRNDLKLVAAFSSLSHVGLIAAGIFAYKYIGFQGSVLQMVVHGINIVGLFYIIDLIESSTGTRDITKLGGVASKSPVFATLAFVIVLGSIAVPITNGFPGEMLLLLSIFMENKLMGIIAGLTIILGAAYMLRVFQRVFMGEVSAAVAEFKPIDTIHLLALGFICILVLAIGIYPQFILDLTAEGSQYLTNLLEIKNN